MKYKILKRLLYAMGAIASGVVSLSFFSAMSGLSGIALLVWEFFALMSAILTLVFVLAFALDNT